MLILGDPETGKTSLIRRLVNDYFPKTKIEGGVGIPFHNKVGHVGHIRSGPIQGRVLYKVGSYIRSGPIQGRVLYKVGSYTRSGPI